MRADRESIIEMKKKHYITMLGMKVEVPPECAADWNENQKRLKTWRKDLLSKQDYLTYLSTFEHEEMVRAFIRVQPKIIDDALYWKCLKHVYINKEVRLSDRLEFWLKCFAAERSNRESFLINDEEKMAFNDLPDTLTIYRGYRHKQFEKGISWTLSLKTAVWFAYRLSTLGGKAMVVFGTCKKADVLGYTNDRQEQEIIIDPRRLLSLKNVKDIGPSPFKQYESGKD